MARLIKVIEASGVVEFDPTSYSSQYSVCLDLDERQDADDLKEVVGKIVRVRIELRVQPGRNHE